MKQISQFFTLFWIIYFPTCIAYNDLPGFSNVDELMTVVLVGYTWIKRHSWVINKEPVREFRQYLILLVFYIVYSLVMAVNVKQAVFYDFVQWIRPFSVIYCTWILNPVFSGKQKKWMLCAMVCTLFSWVVYHPEAREVEAEFPVLGQLAICCGMSWYLFTNETKRNRDIALLLVVVGLIAPKFKFMGEVICFVYIMYYLNKHINFRSLKTIISLVILLTIILATTWTRFDGYYVTGLEDENLARPMTYKTALLVLRDYFPFGPGMGTFATAAAAEYYSPLLYKYHLNKIWGMTEDMNCFIADAFYPTLAEFGVVGVLLFFIFWKRRLKAFQFIDDMKYYRVALMSFFCLAIEQTADTSFLSGKGMGYCMLIGLCLNANKNMVSVEIAEVEQDEEQTFTSVPTLDMSGKSQDNDALE